MSGINDGGPALITACRKCSDPFQAKPWQIKKSDFECPRCKRLRQNSSNATDPLFKEKRRVRNQLPHIKQYLYEYQKNKVSPEKRKARRKVATEIEAGRLMRMPCVVCGSQKTEAHHEDYSKPISVTWLCRKHHIIADAMLAARERKEDA
jgi:late competence protein required for DNA uptake (superfamily II DNA/RNA helicase)